MRIADSAWEQIDRIRTAVAARPSAHSVEEVAQELAAAFSSTYSSVVLARVFLLLPFSALPPDEADIVRRTVGDDARLKAETRVLSLLGTSGREKTWNDRKRSLGHRAIPLLDRNAIEAAPMIWSLLSDLQIDLDAEQSSVAVRKMPGGLNSTFYVEDARRGADIRGRSVIAARDFVQRYDVRTVFGMGGAYLDGAIAIAIIFTDETIDRLVVNRFPSLISNFKMATSALKEKGRLFHP